MSRKIIAFGHKARQGKDIVAEHIAKKHDFMLVRFSDALYDECKKVRMLFFPATFQLIVESGRENIYMKADEDFVHWFRDAEGWEDIEEGLKYRYTGMKNKDPVLLQWYGTEFRRNRSSDYWTNKIKDIFNKFPETNFVLSDMRFTNEAKLVKESGGVCVKVVRLNEDGSQYMTTDRANDHPSEIDLDDWEFDYEFEAFDGHCDELRKMGDALVEKLTTQLDVFEED